MKKNSWWSRLSVVAFIVCAFAVSAIAETLIVDPPVITDPGAQSVMIGVAFVLPLEIVSADNPLKSVTVTGLPAGLKYNAKAKTITGVPAAIPKKATPVTITAKNASKTPAVQTFAITVEPLPAWAYGTFNGYIDGRENSGTASMTVTSLGKITGKLVVWGETYAFSAASYAAGGNPADGFSVTVNPNKQFAPLPLTVSKPAVESAPQALGVVTGKLNDSMNGSCTTNHDCLSISDLP
ncbi:MAG: Ig domain-containing protein, partial [Lentisphaerae bacterium]|nr:Ig domain-containing protein [Lentisphaerota bacterium]